MDFWIKAAVIIAIGFFVYREILKSAKGINHPDMLQPLHKEKAGAISFILVGISVGIFVYAGVSITNIETRDLRPYRPQSAPQMVNIFDQGVIELGGMYIKTNLAKPGELKQLADELTRECHDDGCEAQALFDYVTHIPYKTDYTSRNAKKVIETNWGDCDDKSNLFASLLQEKGLDYRFVYVPHHVFVVVHIENKDSLRFLPAKLIIDGKEFYYAETTASGAMIGEFNGQFPFSFEGIYDIVNDQPVDLETIKFRMG